MGAPEPPLRLGGVEVATLLHRQRSRLVEEVVEAIVRTVPMYADLPDDVIQVDVRKVVHQNLRTFEEGLVGGGLDKASLEEVARSAYRRAEEGIPLQLVQGAYLAGARTAWEAVAGAARPGDEATLRRLGSDVMSHLAEVFSVVSAAYIEELRSDVGEEHSRRSRLLRAMLGGERVRETASALEVDLAAEYVTIALALTHPEPTSRAGLGPQVARRRTIRALRAVLLVDYEHALAQLDSGGGLVVAPVTPTTAWTPEDLDLLLARVTEGCGVAVRAGVARSAPDGVHVAAREAADALAVAVRARPPGWYAMADVVLDHQFSRPGAGAAALRAAMAPLRDQPALVETLRVHLEEELVRSATARRLHVHANTVDYRLGRIRALTGYDPSVPSQLTILRAGLSVLDADEP